MMELRALAFGAVAVAGSCAVSIEAVRVRQAPGSSATVRQAESSAPGRCAGSERQKPSDDAGLPASDDVE